MGTCVRSRGSVSKNSLTCVNRVNLQNQNYSSTISKDILSPMLLSSGLKANSKWAPRPFTYAQKRACILENWMTRIIAAVWARQNMITKNIIRWNHGQACTTIMSCMGSLNTKTTQTDTVRITNGEMAKPMVDSLHKIHI